MKFLYRNWLIFKKLIKTKNKNLVEIFKSKSDVDMQATFKYGIDSIDLRVSFGIVWLAST